MGAAKRRLSGRAARYGTRSNTFSCGIEILTTIWQVRKPDVAKRVAVCFVLTLTARPLRLLYVSQYSVHLTQLPREDCRQTPEISPSSGYTPRPVAIDKRFRGRKLGEFLLLDALYVLAASRQDRLGCRDCRRERRESRRFYEHFEFLALPHSESSLSTMRQSRTCSVRLET